MSVSKRVVVDKIANLFSITVTWETTGDRRELLKSLPEDVLDMAVEQLNKKLEAVGKEPDAGDFNQEQFKKNSQARVVSNGTKTVLTINGNPVGMVQSIKWEARAGELLPTMEVMLLAPDVDLEVPVDQVKIVPKQGE